MICPLCGSNEFSWSYERGEVACRKCGLVIETIYDSIPIKNDAGNYKDRFVSYRRFVYSKEKSYHKFIELKRRIGDRGDLHIDSVAFQVYVSRKDRSGLKLLYSSRNNKAWEALHRNSELREILEKIVVKHPILASRTIRGRIAAAYVILMLLKGLKPSPREIAEKTGVSMTQAKRIVYLVEKKLDILPDLKSKAFSYNQ